MYIEIRIKGQLSDAWADWLEGLAISNKANGDAVIRGEVPDQAALVGLMNRIHALNLKITAYRHVTSRDADHDPHSAGG
jgi:hypothetical protein